MSFDDSQVFDVRHRASGMTLVVTWTSPLPAGTLFQLYMNRQLAWSGLGLRASVPLPFAETAIHVGAVGPGESRRDFSASLPAPPGGGRRVRLTWYAGTYLDDDIYDFLVYKNSTPGGAVDFATPVDTVAFSVMGRSGDGYGRQRYGRVPYGRGETKYTWTSARLSAGVHNFAVKGMDKAGNEGIVATASATILAPPEPPGLVAGSRVIASYNPSTSEITLTWNASPSA
jgi:hypothetical protein